MYYAIEAMMSRVVTEKEDDLYEMAKRYYRNGFAMVLADAMDLPEELLGEIVEVLDITFPTDSVEPNLYIAGYDMPVPMSNFATCV